jgi:hypothetical protein
MEKRQVSQDDIQDVIEMSNKIIDHIEEITQDVETDIAISCIMTTTANFIFQKSNSISQGLFYKRVFSAIMDQMADSLKKLHEKDRQ